MFDEVENILDIKYVNAFQTRIRVNKIGVDEESYFYIHRKANLLYPTETMVDYTLHLMCGDHEIHTIVGEAKKDEETAVELPRGYNPDDEGSYTVNKGKGIYTGESIIIKGASALDMSIAVVKVEKDQKSDDEISQ